MSLNIVCRFLEITARTIQNWRRYGEVDKRKGSARLVTHRLSAGEEQAFYELANQPRFADRKPEEIVAILLTEKTYLASVSTLYRILRRRKALRHRQESKKPIASAGPLTIAVTAPNQVWAWDITWLKTDVRGIFIYAYSIIDVFDRRLVGWCIEDHESEDLAKALFERILRDTKVRPRFIHADNGNPMRGATLAVFLESLGITRSHSRPRVSNDNAFIESWHKTLKYTVGYPVAFHSLTEARAWFADFVDNYNERHMHSGLDYVTPMQAHTGESLRIYERRNQTLLAARAANPERWRTDRTRTYSHPSVSSYCRPFLKEA